MNFRYAFIEFSSPEGKEAAKLLNNTIFKDRQIKVIDKRKNIPDYFGERSN
jgi:polyadenylate-binding protein 2